MKRIKCMLSMLLLLALTACGAGAPVNNCVPPVSDAPAIIVPPVQPAEKEVVAPVYVFDYDTQSASFTLEDGGEEYASYSYTFPCMSVSNFEDLLPAEQEVAQRNISAFNGEMETKMNDAVAFGESLAEEIRMLLEEENFPWVGFDETATSITRAGNIITVRADCYYFGGGAHPDTYTLSYTFDLSVGQFIDPAQIGDDPEIFRQSVAELLVVQAEGLGEEYTEGYWDDYASIISQWNDTAVFFDERGMTVFFSPYELGPYAMGPVELFLDYETLRDALGPGGLVHLGVTE